MSLLAVITFQTCYPTAYCCTQGMELDQGHEGGMTQDQLGLKWERENSQDHTGLEVDRENSRISWDWNERRK